MMNQRSIKLLGLIFMLIILFMTNAQAVRPVMRNLTTIVKDINQIPLQNASIYIYNETDDILLASGITDATGAYKKKLNTGTYLIVIKKENYTTREVTQELVNNDIITIILTNIDDDATNTPMANDTEILYIGIIAIMVAILFTIFFILLNKRAL